MRRRRKNVFGNGQKPDGACFPLRKKDREMRQPAGGFGGLRHTRKQKQCFVTLPQAEKLT